MQSPGVDGSCARKPFWLAALALLLVSFPHRQLGAEAAPDTRASAELRRKLGNSTAESPKRHRIEYVNGSVKLTSLTGESDANLGRLLKAPDQLATGVESEAILLRLGSSTDLAENTKVEIKPDNGLKLHSGRLYRLSTGDQLTMETPDGSVSPIGTEFQLEVDPTNGVTRLWVRDGSVILTNLYGSITNTVPANETQANVSEASMQANGQPKVEPAGVITFNRIIQWVLYYPAILDLEDLSQDFQHDPAWQPSFQAYRMGDLVGAREAKPKDTPATLPASRSETLYRAALLFSAGHIDEAEPLLKSLQATAGDAPKTPNTSCLAKAFEVLSDAIRNEPSTNDVNLVPQSATEWLARSYYLQSRSDLRTNISGALDAARQATSQNTNFILAWSRVAELEFSRGYTRLAQEALERARHLGADSAQILSLQGYLYAADGENDQAIESFAKAVKKDGRLGDPLLGLGLCLIRQRDPEKKQQGLQYLQQAAAREPQRATFKSYLAKGYAKTANYPAALAQLGMAKRADPNDPTPWLYSALIKQEENRINEAIEDLEKSKELNDNRMLFRSRALLDQDRAVRSANLAAIYRDAGMTDLSVREATRAVADDYSNASAHLFLANSYDALRDPRQITLRYETPWANELLLANLLAPVGSGSLSQRVSQQEYSRMFEGDHWGLFSYTEYRSSGEWLEQGSHYGTFGKTSYSLDTYYLSQPGFRPNEDQENRTYWLKAKHQFTPADSALVQVILSDVESGDLNSYYDPTRASQTQRIREKQEPIVMAGYHHEWSPLNHTLFLAARLSDHLSITNQAAPSQVLVKDANTNVISRFFPTPLNYDLDYLSKLEIYSLEAQHIWQSEDGNWEAILGGRYQFGEFTTYDRLSNPSGYPFFPPLIFSAPLTTTNVTTDFRRGSAYLYVNRNIGSHLQLIGGVAYDTIDYPDNHRAPPISADEGSRDQISPKAGFIWTPGARTTVRGSYTRSLGGVSFDQSFRIEPSQIAGFIQSYRSLIPESLVGSVVVPTSDLGGIQLEHQLRTRTYMALRGEWLASDTTQQVGLFQATALPFGPIRPDQTPVNLQFRERNVIASINQLLGNQWALGATYRLSYADLEQNFDRLPQTFGFNPSTQEARSQQLDLGLHYNLPCGFFAQAQGIWCQQDNLQPTPVLPSEDFWQMNLFAGYRFLKRRGEVRVGVLNLSDQDYRLNPINLINYLPRERLFFTSLKLNF